MSVCVVLDGCMLSGAVAAVAARLAGYPQGSNLLFYEFVHCDMLTLLDKLNQ